MQAGMPLQVDAQRVGGAEPALQVAKFGQVGEQVDDPLQVVPPWHVGQLPGAGTVSSPSVPGVDSGWQVWVQVAAPVHVG